jgi:proline-specific peptidase
MPIPSKGQHIDIGDTRLYIVERGAGYPLIVLHGGPGLDHHMFGDYLDPLSDEFRLLLVDQRAQGASDACSSDTWTLKQMAKDIVSLAHSLDLDKYAVLGHSYGAFVALQNAVDYPSCATQTIVSSGLPSAKYLKAVTKNLDEFQPVELRDQVTKSWARESQAQTPEEVASILHDQNPFHFANPLDVRIAGYEKRTSGAAYSPLVLQHFAKAEYGGIEVEDQLDKVTQPVLVLAGRHDRTCTVEGAEIMAKGLPRAELVIFEKSAHMTFVEQQDQYLQAVRDFLNKHK